MRCKAGQSIRIGDDIRVSIRAVQGGGQVVNFGIDAPAEVPVHRLEIFELIQTENRAASAGNALAWLKGKRDE
ncbi:MAG TPA: carbon storage regulator [Mariprofundaceae bacterium]|nr:carbon storage regulator [Mariprofundaceae bacterium]